MGLAQVMGMLGCDDVVLFKAKGHGGLGEFTTFTFVFACVVHDCVWICVLIIGSAVCFVHAMGRLSLMLVVVVRV